MEQKITYLNYIHSNNIYLNAISEEVDLLGMFHTLLHTEENGLKIVIYQQSVQFLHKLYRMCSVTDGCRVKQIMTTIEEILNQRYVIFQLLYLKNMTIEKKLITMSVFVVPVLLFDFFSMVVEVVVDEVVGGLLVLLVEVQVVVVDGSQVEGVQVQP